MILTKAHVETTKDGYNVNLPLKHNQVAAIIDQETGDIEQVDIVPSKTKGKRTDPDVILFEPHALFTKNFPVGWKWLYFNTKPLEYKAASYLAMKAQPVTNSLKPLGDSSTVREIANELNISTGKVKYLVDRLFELGVFAKFEVINANKEHTKYWVFNPYLMFTGKYLKVSVWELFKDTTIAKLHDEQTKLPCADC